MRNIAVFLIFVSISISVYGQESRFDFSFSVAPQIGFIHGRAFEYVYNNGYFNNDMPYQSKLFYDMKPVFYGGLQADFTIINKSIGIGGFASVSFKAGIPGDSGIHENRDWLSDSNNLTDFSRHTNRTDELYLLDGSIGFIFSTDFFYIKPFFSGSWMRLSFTGRDGYGDYSYYKPEWKYVDWSGQTAITYEQNWFLAGIGYTIGTKILNLITIEFTLKFIPFIYCHAIDQHLSVLHPDGFYTPYQSFYDYLNFGLGIEPGFSIIYNINKIDISLDFNYRHIGETKGDSFKYNNWWQKSKAGASINIFDTRFLISYTF